MSRLLLTAAALAIALGLSAPGIAEAGCTGSHATQTVSTPAPVDTAETSQPATGESDGSG